MICSRTCQLITRYVFLLFIVLVTAYFFISNEKTEKFENSVQWDKVITTIYMDLFKRPPNAGELKFYIGYVQNNPNISQLELQIVIESSADEVAKTIESNVKSIAQIENAELMIIQTFNELLDRNPTPIELNKYKEYTRDKLVYAVISSDEYVRMEKTQSNEIYSTLPGGITDRQITMKISNVYQTVTGKTYIDEDTMRFFKQKFLEMNLDEAKFKVFLERYVTWQPMNDSSIGAVTKTSITKTSTDKNVAQLQEALEKAQHKADEKAKKEAEKARKEAAKRAELNRLDDDDETARVYYNNATIYNIYTVGSTDYMGMPNKQYLKNISADNVGSTIENIQCQKGDIRNFLSEQNKAKATEYSSLIDSRNKDQLASTCARNTRFNALDEDYASVFYSGEVFNKDDMVLDPSLSWSVPQKRTPICAATARCDVGVLNDQTALIGTPLSDAQLTKVGSILPPLPPS